MIDHIDPVNRLVYLDKSTVNTLVHPIDIYRAMRNLRLTDESLRPFDVFMTMRGAEKKNPSGSKRTERYLVLLGGTYIVPFDAEGYLTIDETIISDIGLEGVECFNRNSLSNRVDINYIPKQVEIITVASGGTGLTQEEHDKLMAIPTSASGLTKEEHDKLMSLPDATEVMEALFELRDVGDNTTTYMVDGYAEPGYVEPGYVGTENLSNYVDEGYVVNGYIMNEGTSQNGTSWSYSDKLIKAIWNYGVRSLTVSTSLTQAEKDHLMSLQNCDIVGQGLTQAEKDHLMSLQNCGITQAEKDHLMSLQNCDMSEILGPSDFKPLFEYDKVTIVEAE